MKTASKELRDKLAQYFSDHLYSDDEELRQTYLSKRIRGLSVNLSLFETEENLEAFFNSFVKTIEVLMYKDKDTNLFDAFVIQIKYKYLFIKKHIKVENSAEYDLIIDLPFTEKDENEDQFPSISYALN